MELIATLAAEPSITLSLKCAWLCAGMLIVALCAGENGPRSSDRDQRTREATLRDGHQRARGTLCQVPSTPTRHRTPHLDPDPARSIIELLSASDMMVTSSLVALEGLEEKECEEAAGALVGYFDEHEAKPPEPVIRGTLTAIPLAGEPPSPSRHRGPRGARERAVGRSFRRA